MLCVCVCKLIGAYKNCIAEVVESNQNRNTALPRIQLHKRKIAFDVAYQHISRMQFAAFPFSIHLANLPGVL